MKKTDILGKIINNKEVLENQLLVSILENTEGLSDTDKTAIRKSIISVVHSNTDNLIDRIQKS